jgi:hypothetical protein
VPVVKPSISQKLANFPNSDTNIATMDLDEDMDMDMDTDKDTGTKLNMDTTISSSTIS